ncbi:hypothetical protein RKD40_007453 [Streptomyces ambofaciens]
MFERRVQEILGVVMGQRILDDVLRLQVVEEVGQAAGVLEQLAHGDHPPVVAVAAHDAGQVALDRRVEADATLSHELEQGSCREHLGHAADPEPAVAMNRCLVRHVADTAGQHGAPAPIPHLGKGAGRAVDGGQPMQQCLQTGVVDGGGGLCGSARGGASWHCGLCGADRHDECERAHQRTRVLDHVYSLDRRSHGCGEASQLPPPCASTVPGEPVPTRWGSHPDRLSGYPPGRDAFDLTAAVANSRIATSRPASTPSPFCRPQPLLQGMRHARTGRSASYC